MSSKKTRVTKSVKVAPYSLTIALTLMTNAQVICARSNKNISVFRFLWRQHEHKKQIDSKYSRVSFGESFLKLGGVVTTYISYKTFYFCQKLSELI